jgi:hypothetical protein
MEGHAVNESSPSGAAPRAMRGLAIAAGATAVDLAAMAEQA